MRTICLFVVGLLLSVVLGGAPVSAYNGIELSYASVGNFTLVDQNNSEYKLSDATEEIVVVSFFFTRCPDVCPVITQNLK
ncbi:MAG: SCO family protein, partial [Candidatus Thermoplasmatota archaeon]|nr:SCO family protein [Candidatus Thermoplasmatota archaeon]